MLRQGAPAALVCLAIAGMTACGAATKPAPPVDAKAAGPDAVAKAIQSRLQAAGYTIEALPLSGHLSPQPATSFKFEVDFASPRSFTVNVLVFRSARAAALFERKALAQCERIPACKRARAAQRAHSRQQVVGAVAYSAYTDYGNAILPVRDFDKVVALASGHPSG